MRRRNKWLAYGTVLTGLLIVGVLLLTVNRGPLVRGFRPPEGEITLSDFCLWCAEDQDVTPVDVMGIVLIGLVALLVPASHIALLIMLAARVSRPPRFSDLEPAYRCPRCAHPLVRQWRVCPYCGAQIRDLWPAEVPEAEANG